MTLVRRMVSRLCASIGLAFLLVTCTPLVSWYGGMLAGQWNDPEGDTLIVLGGGDLADGFPSENTVLRCLYAVRAYQDGHFRKIVVSGYRIGGHMRNVLVSEGVPAAAIVTDDESRSTRENALQAARLLSGDKGSKVLLTSDYHMLRARGAFRKAGLDVLPRPIPDARKRATHWIRRWPTALDEAVETVKIVYYSARGWI
jgi:uncharacterized SAM-binding protein YcdF (DUF218 family)